MQMNLAIAHACNLSVVVATVPVGNYTLGVAPFAYGNPDAPLGINLAVMEDGSVTEPFADLTTAVRGAAVEQDELVVKTYNENDMLREPMLASGLFQDTGKRLQLPMSVAEVWRVTDAFVNSVKSKVPTLQAS